MGHKEKRIYLDQIRKRYKAANKVSKKTILDEFCAVCGYHRKHAIRLLNGPYRRTKQRKKVGRKAKYNSPAFINSLKTLWFATD
jgi:hypothetical protein